MNDVMSQIPLKLLIAEIISRINDNPDLALLPIMQGLESTLRILAQDAHMSRTGEL